MADIVYPGEDSLTTLNGNAMPANEDLVIYKGDFVELDVNIANPDTTAKDLTGYTAKAQLKTAFNDVSPVNFTCTITDAVNGKVKIYLSSTNSSTLVPGSYIWDFQITSGAGETRTYLAGDVNVYPEVTT